MLITIAALSFAKQKRRIELHVSGMARMCASLDSPDYAVPSCPRPRARRVLKRIGWMGRTVCENFTVSVTSLTDGVFPASGFSVTFTAGMNRRFSNSSFPAGTKLSTWLNCLKYDFHLTYLLKRAIEQASPFAAFRCSSGGRSCRRPALRTS